MEKLNKENVNRGFRSTHLNATMTISENIIAVLLWEKNFIGNFEKLDKTELVQKILLINPWLKPETETVIDNRIFAFSKVFNYRFVYK
jgi:hypothetical protein